jgi:energy-coupling factor transport system permease protein
MCIGAASEETDMIELSRYIPFGQYVNNGSYVARLDPRTKVISAILFIACISFISKFAAFVFCLIFCLVLQQTSRISILYVLRSLSPLVVLLVFAFVVQVLFYVSPDHAPLLWQWWVLNISWEGISIGILSIVRVIFLYYLATMMTFTTSLVDLTDGMEILLAPLQKIGIPVSAFIMVLVIAFKFVPIFVGEIERLIKAQAARGMNFGQGNLSQRVRKLTALLIPLFVSAFKRMKILTVALEARCFGGRPGWQRSKRRTLKYERIDVWAFALTISLCIVIIVVNIISPL